MKKIKEWFNNLFKAPKNSQLEKLEKEIDQKVERLEEKKKPRRKRPKKKKE